MANLRCERISEGLRASEALAIFRDHKGKRTFFGSSVISYRNKTVITFCRSESFVSITAQKWC